MHCSFTGCLNNSAVDVYNYDILSYRFSWVHCIWKVHRNLDCEILYVLWHSCVYGEVGDLLWVLAIKRKSCLFFPALGCRV